MRREVRFSSHAVERYVELIRPSLSAAAAFQELLRVRGLGDRVDEPPEWYHRAFTDRDFAEEGSPANADQCVGYLVWGDVAFPLVNAENHPGAVLAVTCVARGAVSEKTRKRRNADRARFVEKRRRPDLKKSHRSGPRSP